MKVLNRASVTSAVTGLTNRCFVPSSRDKWFIRGLPSRVVFQPILKSSGMEMC
jgi:hypothetical protein